MHSVATERVRLIVQLERIMEWPLLFLSLLWVVLAVIELTHGLNAFGSALTTAVWLIFIADFTLKFVIAPAKITFLRRNWLAAVSLLLPAFRLARAWRAMRMVRVIRGFRAARLLSAINRGMRGLRRALRQHAAGYVAAATVLVVLSGAAGMMSFEGEGTNSAAFGTYSESLWWTTMLMTTIGSEHWPQTGGGRAVTLFLSLYAIAVFSYVTATLASLFIRVSDNERARRN